MKKRILVCLVAALAAGLILTPVQQAETLKPNTGYKKFKLEYPDSGIGGLGAIDLDGNGADELAVLWSIYRNGQNMARLVVYEWRVGGFTTMFETADITGEAGGIHVVDLDSDGKDDILVILNGLKFYKNDGAKLVNKGNILKINVNRKLFCGDLNGDGLKDLAVGTRIPYVGFPRVYKQIKGSSSAADSAAKPKFKSMKKFPGPADYYMMTGFNVNKDNRIDIICTAYQNGIISLYQNQGNFKFKKLHTHTCIEKVTGIAAGDLNNDGYDDIIFYPGSGKASGLMNQKGTKFEHYASDTYTGHSFNIVMTDINNDSHLDILVSISSTPAHILLMKNNGNMTFDNKKSKAKGEEPDHFTIGDFNGDRRPDIAFGERIILWALNAPRSFRLKLAHVNQVSYTQDKRLIIKGKYFKLIKGTVKIDGKAVAADKISSWSKNNILIQNLTLSKGAHTCLVLAKGEGSTPITFTVDL